MLRYFDCVPTNKLSPFEDVSDSIVVFSDERCCKSLGTDMTFQLNLVVEGSSLELERIFFSQGYYLIPYRRSLLSGSVIKIFLKNSSSMAKSCFEMDSLGFRDATLEILNPPVHFFSIQNSTLRPGIIETSTLEGELAKKHVKDKHTQSPNIDLIGVVALEKDLRRHVASSPTESVDGFVLLSGKSKVTNFGHVIVHGKLGKTGRRQLSDAFLALERFLLFSGGQQNVFSLDVPVDDVFAMHVLEPLYDVPSDAEGLLNAQHVARGLCDFGVQISLVTIFHHHKYPALI